MPGEDCDDNHKCLDQNNPDWNSTCTNGKCSGIAFNEKCNSTSQCLSGNFCNSTSVCSTQLKENDVCSSSFDCQNHLGCFEKKCTALGKKAVGQDLNVTTGVYNETTYPDFAIEYFCEMGSVDKNYKCSQTNYTGPQADAKVIDKDGFVKCDWKTDCHYSDGASTFTQECGCGYNTAGQGYCPIATYYNAKKYKDAVSHKVNVLKNTCHSKTRFECYKNDAKLQGMARWGEQQTSNAHLYHGAVDCASDVLGSAFLNMSVALIAVVVAFLF